MTFYQAVRVHVEKKASILTGSTVPNPRRVDKNDIVVWA
jgi:hypothetical protein